MIPIPAALISDPFPALQSAARLHNDHLPLPVPDAVIRELEAFITRLSEYPLWRSMVLEARRFKDQCAREESSHPPVGPFGTNGSHAPSAARLDAFNAFCSDPARIAAASLRYPDNVPLGVLDPTAFPPKATLATQGEQGPPQTQTINPALLHAPASAFSKPASASAARPSTSTTTAGMLPTHPGTATYPDLRIYQSMANLHTETTDSLRGLHDELHAALTAEMHTCLWSLHGEMVRAFTGVYADMKTVIDEDRARLGEAEGQVAALRKKVGRLEARDKRRRGGKKMEERVGQAQRERRRMSQRSEDEGQSGSETIASSSTTPTPAPAPAPTRTTPGDPVKKPTTHFHEPHIAQHLESGGGRFAYGFPSNEQDSG